MTLNLIAPHELLQIRDRLLADDVVAIPTETVYGLAASIESDTALRKVFALKQRPFFDPLIVHIASFKQAQAITREWPPIADYLARVFWPGPLTLVLPKAPSVNPLITSGLDTVAIRMPRHTATQELLRTLGIPLAAPSANRFGKTSPSRAEHVASEFPEERLLILDGGPCEVGVESTVISFVLSDANAMPAQPDEVHILRPGGVTQEELETALKKWARPSRVVHVERSPQSPGTLKHHYMPKIPLVVISGEAEISEGRHLRRLEEALSLRPQKPAELILDPDPALAARSLYHEMRRLAESGADLLYVRRRPEQAGGFWNAIWDRLGRAATLDLSQST